MKYTIYTFLLSFLIMMSGLIMPFNSAQAQLSENFEEGDKTFYAPATITLESGDWLFDDALIGTLDSDGSNGARSARIRDGFIQTEFDVPDGFGEISFYASNFSSDSGGAVQLSYSDDGGSSWEPIGEPINVTSEFTQYSINANVPGNLRLRIEKTAGNRVNIDDVLISEYIESTEEPALNLRVNDANYESGDSFDFGSTTGSATASLRLGNTGLEDLVISEAEIEGGAFSTDSPLEITLEHLENQTFELVFSAEEAGFYEGAITLQTNDPENETFVLNLSGEVLDTTQPIPIAEARELPAGTLVTVAGHVTVAEQFAGPMYFQDDTGGIAWYNDDAMRQDYLVGAAIGDSLVVTGEIGDFNNLVQIVNDTGYEVFPEANRDIQPIDITLEELNSGLYEGWLVRVSNLEFAESGTFSGGTNYDVTDGTAEGQLRVDNFTNIGGSNIPNSPAQVTGAAGRFLDTQQILPRFTDDIQVLSGAVIVSAAPYETGATESSITFEWETEFAGHSEVRYGTTSSLELGSVIDEEPKTEHSITLSGLEAATAYNVQIRSAVDTDTTATSILISSTGSPAGSTGEIITYFNKEVADELAIGEVANQNVNFSEQLIERIDAAEESAVFGFYSLSGEVGNAVADAIIAAHNRGVDVRVIQSGHSGNTNAIVDRMSSNGVRAVQSLGEAQHHNKYAAIDAHHSDPSKAWVVTSSWNATDSGTFQQFQNMVNIQDVALARAYELEFNQTWGGDSGDFNPGAARFSEDKEIVNPSAFWIGEEETYVELHFSPQANTEAQINRALNTAQESIDLGLNLITRRAISNTMLSRFNDGVDVRGAIGVTGIQGSDFEYLQSWADVHEFSQSQFGLLHHKYAIVDGEQPGENSKVITGSHNWSGNANFENDENTLIIHSPRVANEFFQEYAARYWQAGGEDSFDVPVSVEDADQELPATA
ncbi:MAG: phospholipase D-like domain-containing protein [Cyclonatronaceae bacterium]